MPWDAEQLELPLGVTTSQVKELQEALVGKKIIDIKDGVILCVEDVNMREIGTSSPSPWTSWLREEYNPELRGYQGFRKYDQMRRSDTTVSSTLRLIKTPILAGRWFMEPASESVRDKNVAEFVWNNLTKWMTCSFPQLLHEALLMLEFGYYMFEKVFQDDHPAAPGKVIWRKLAPRHPMDVLEWKYDGKGGPSAVKMANPIGDVDNDIFIPIDKLLVFTYQKEAGDMTGLPLLRPAYRNFYYKEQFYKIDAIQKERHGIGIPVITLPANNTDSDRRLAEDLGRNLRTNERAHVVLPPNWTLEFAKLVGQPVNAMESAEHHDHAIEKNILAHFISRETGTTQDTDYDLFMKSTRFIADCVLDVFNKYAIPQLVDYNWTRVGYPQLRARRIGEQQDQRTMSFAVRNYIGAKVIQPDDRLEAFIREEMDLPAVDEETVREVATPQAGSPTPPRVGPPRQGKPTAKPPAKNAGTDRSGGK